MNDPYAAYGRPIDAAPPRTPSPAPSPAYSGPMPSDPAELFPHLVAQESGGRAGVLGPETPYGRAQGRTQMLPATAQEMAQRLGVPWRPEMVTGTTPEASAYQDRLGMEYLRQGYEQTGNMRDALRYYHGGPNRELWGPKTDAYADQVLSRYGQGGGQSSQARAAADPYASYGRPVDPNAEPMPFQGSEENPIEVEINRGIVNVNGRAIARGGGQPDEDLGPWDRYWADQSRSHEERQRLAARRADPAYQAEYARAQGGAENVPDAIAALLAGQTLGGKGIVPYVTGAVSYLDAMGRGVDPGLASQAGRDATRDTMDAFASEHPGQNLGYQLLGGLLTPGLKGTGEWIGGASGAARTGRAAVVGGGYGAASGFLGGEGGVGDRIRSGLIGGGVGAATGGLLDAGMRRAVSGAARRVANPSPARVLSREGVSLTPGQMVESTPVIGPMLRGLEDAASSIPLAGSAIQGARNEGVESFNRAALNRALAPIGQSLPRSAKPGYGAVEEVQRRLGAAYSDVLPNISAQLDQPLYDDIARVLDDAAAEMPADRIEQLGRVLQNRVFRNVDQADATITGEQFKRIESELGALARQYRNANDPAAASFGDAVSGIQNAMREMIARQNPQQAARIRQINQGYANLVRIEKAAGSGPAEAADGVFTPTQLGIAARQGTGRSSRAVGGGLLQDLAAAGRQVLPNKVGDSGTASRGAVTAIVGGGAAGLLSPQLAVPVIAAAGAYSKPAQAALNAIYRATDSQSAFSALAELQRFAGRNPALQPYYQAAVEAVRRAFPSQSPEPAPAASGLLSPTGP